MDISFTRDIYDNLNSANNAVAICINEEYTSYSQLNALVGKVQNKIRTENSVFGIATQNHVEIYAAIIAIWLTGKSYVPIDLSYPTERIDAICKDAGITTILVAEETEAVDKIKSALTGLQFHSIRELPEGEIFNTFPNADKVAYTLFTSGTTGKPKGVPITFGNLQAFLYSFQDLGYKLDRSDKFLQMFELTFDLSVMSFTVPLTLGASFYTLPSGMIKTLGLYHTLESKNITFSLMVPSAIQLLAAYMDDIQLPYLRYSQFCGEALKADILSKWFNCIPAARVDNVYGPTEATIYCSYLTVNPYNLLENCKNGIVGIGKAMSNTTLEIFDTNKTICEIDTLGELCISGKQLTPGYLNNPEQNEKSFFHFNQSRFYHSGDLAAKDSNGNIFYHGRLDDQVKIQGYRIELAEIELAATKVLPNHANVAVGVLDKAGAWQIILFIQNTNADTDILRTEIGALLPPYMVPHAIYSIDEFPLNQNGKIDKNILRKQATNWL